MAEHLARALAPPAVALLAVAMVLGGGYVTLTTHEQVTPVATTEGEVLDLTVTRVVAEGTGRGTDNVYYEVDGRYRYTVDGETYVGERVGRPDPVVIQTEGGVRRFRDDVVTDGGVTVHYRPADPGIAYLTATYPIEWLLVHTAGWVALLGLVAADAAGVASRGRNLAAGVPLLGRRTPFGTLAAVPVYAAGWYAALVPWRWYLRLGDPNGFGLLPVPLAVGALVVWTGVQVRAWLLARLGGGEGDRRRGPTAGDDDAPPDPDRPWVPGNDSGLVPNDASLPGDEPHRDPPADADPGGLDDVDRPESDDGIEYADWGSEDGGDEADWGSEGGGDG